MKVIMVMVARRFTVDLDYERFDLAKGTKGMKSVYGERGYQIDRAQPSGNLPCIVAEC